MTDEVAAVRARTDLVELIGQQVPLKKAGKTWKGLCPFHDDKNPSFSVDPATGTYRCWSCGARGDAFNWLIETEKLSFSEALATLAKRAGIELKRTGRRERADTPNDRELMAEALRFFRAELERAPHAKSYCAARGLDEQTQAHWQIGYAPDMGTALATHLSRKGLSLGRARELFLVERDGAGNYYDRFRDRLIFPILGMQGEPLAFGGRLVRDGQPKYVNSSDTPIYSKRRVLYGFSHAREAISRTRRAVLAEGYLDVIACHRAGITSAVASLGTSLSEEQVQLLSKWCAEVVIAYDGDEAGLKAAERAAEMIAGQGLRARVASLPAGLDPDTLLRTVGPDGLAAACETGLSPVEFKLLRLEATLDTARPEFWDAATAILAECQSHLELDRHIVRLAQKAPGIRDPLLAQRSLRRQIAQHRKPRAPARKGSRAAVAMPAGPSLKMLGSERVLMQALLHAEHRAAALEAFRDPSLIVTSSVAEAGSAVAALRDAGQLEGEPADWLAGLQPPEAAGLLMDIAHAEGEVLNSSILNDAIRDLERRREMRNVVRLHAEAAPDDPTLEEIQARLRRLKA